MKNDLQKEQNQVLDRIQETEDPGRTKCHPGKNPALLATKVIVCFTMLIPPHDHSTESLKCSLRASIFFPQFT